MVCTFLELYDFLLSSGFYSSRVLEKRRVTRVGPFFLYG